MGTFGVEARDPWPLGVGQLFLVFKVEPKRGLQFQFVPNKIPFLNFSLLSSCFTCDLFSVACL